MGLHGRLSELDIIGRQRAADRWKLGSLEPVACVVVGGRRDRGKETAQGHFGHLETASETEEDRTYVVSTAHRHCIQLVPELSMCV